MRIFHTPAKERTEHRLLTILRMFALFGLVLLALIKALDARAQTGVPEIPLFTIERIEVEGVKVASPQTVIAESLLELGKSYTENEFKRAIYRINRLPFVIKAEFSLRKGSERGRYILVITVIEVKRFFFGVDVWGKVAGPRINYEDYSDFGVSSDLTDHRENKAIRYQGIAGMRVFLSPYTEATLATTGLSYASTSDVTKIGVDAEAGLTFYNVFQKGGILGGYLCRSEQEFRVFPLALDPTFSNWSFEDMLRLTLRAVLPVGGDNSLRLQVVDERANEGYSQAITRERHDFFGLDFICHGKPEGCDIASERRGDQRFRQFELGWFFDSTDDPLFPRSGRIFGLAADHLELSSDQWVDYWANKNDSGMHFEKIDQGTFSSNLTRVSGQGAQVTPLTTRQSLAIHARVAYGRGRSNNLREGFSVYPSFAGYGLEAGAGISHYFNSRSRDMESRREWWVVSQAEVAYERLSRTGPLVAKPFLKARVGATLAHRSPWGLFRLTLEYLSIRGGRP